MNFKPELNLKNGLIGGGVLLLIIIIIYSWMYSVNIENKFVKYNQKLVLENYTIEKANKLVITNGVGNINIVKSDVDDIKVTAHLLYKDDIKDIESIEQIKMNVSESSTDGEYKTVILSPIADNEQNYFSFMDEKGLIGGLKINYEIRVPKYLEEVYVYNPVGDFSAYNIDASLNIESVVGNIFLSDIDPKNFIVARTNRGDININLSEKSNAKYIGASADTGDINVYVNGNRNIVSGNTPKVVKIQNDMFELEMYDKILNDFEMQQQYDNENLKIALKTKEGNALIVN